MGIVLDTSVLIAAERGLLDLPALFSAYPEETFHLSSVTASELLHGVERANTPERRHKRSNYVEAVLQRLSILPFDLEVARCHAKIWAALEVSGKVIGLHDMLIAATALQNEHMLATLNQDEFQRITKLKLVPLSSFAIQR
jgi:tRNA(fMet)-specific endonuclease VapC